MALWLGFMLLAVGLGLIGERKRRIEAAILLLVAVAIVGIYYAYPRAI